MKNSIILITFLFLFGACGTKQNRSSTAHEEVDFTLAFGSCNKHDVKNNLWDDVVKAKPDVWIWGGDIVYADTEDMTKLAAIYKAQNEVDGYKLVKSKMPVIGTWDDHDYGLNDGGTEFEAKKQSQQKFLDFMGVSQDSFRRSQEGVYASHHFRTNQGTVKVLVLDTRYFRTALTPDTETKKRNKPNAYGEGTILGEKQWHWLQNELNTSKADFNVIVSSIQFLSNKHGFECWANFPHEVDRLQQTIAESSASGVMILSGDRHISEFSSSKIDGVAYPLIDFTSSGLTHVYSAFNGEFNPFRVGEVIKVKSFGLVSFNFQKKLATFKIIGDQGKVLGKLQQNY